MKRKVRGLTIYHLLAAYADVLIRVKEREEWQPRLKLGPCKRP